MQKEPAKDFIEKREWYRSEYFINPKTGDVYDCYRIAIHRCKTGLQRFIDAQNKDNTYQTALKEIKEGCIKTRCGWFIFPQMASLSDSDISEFYGIVHRGEAMDYMENEILRDRLIEATEALYNSHKSVYELFGKFSFNIRNCMLLFSTVSDHTIFKKMLEKYCWK